MLGLLACTLVASYLVAALFALARNWELGNHGLRRVSARDTARVALEAAAWPLEALWLELPEYFSREWALAVPRYQGVAS